MYVYIVDSSIKYCSSTTIQRKSIVPFLLQQFPYFYIVYDVRLLNNTRERTVALPRQQWLYERATVLRDTYIAHLVICLSRRVYNTVLVLHHPAKVLSQGTSET